MYSTHNVGKSVAAEIFTSTLKNKKYKHMTSISRNVYVDNIDDKVNEYNNTDHRKFKMKPNDVKDIHILTLLKKLMMKIPNLKLVIMSEYQNTKAFLLKAILQIGLKKFL